MKYEQERGTSGEILRLVIQKMAAHPATFAPLNYTVWYEHLAGINPGLSAAMNHLLSSGKKLDDDVIDHLYGQFISETGHKAEQAFRDGMQQLLGKVANFAEQADQQVSQFGNSLQTYNDSLRPDLDLGKLETLIGNMSKDTHKLHDSMQHLQSQLEASKQEVEKLNRELKSAQGAALTDPLTGVANRRGFEAATQVLLDDPAIVARGICMLMLDIDHFKKINDTFGHLFGDKVIQALGSLLKTKVKGQDVVARLGGEEFGVLLPETTIEGAHVVAEQIRQGIEKSKIRRQDAQEPIGGITISIGIASYHGDLTAMMDQADQALYVSKQSGRNRTTVFGHKGP
jgi:diguanylate cyclase